MRIAFICQAVDLDDPINAATTRWIEVLARTPGVDTVRVLALRVGAHDLPENVHVTQIGGGGAGRTLIRFYRGSIAALRSGVDAFFVHQGGAYPALLLPLKLLTGTPIYQWKAHSHLSRSMRFYARYCDRLIFTATRQSFPMDLAKVSVVGHGIDTDHFRRIGNGPREGLITVGRISSVKGLLPMIRMLAVYRDEYGQPPTLEIVGPVTDRAYKASLEREAKRLAIDDAVEFRGPVHRRELPALLSRRRVFLHYCGGALSRSVLEAMACGVPPLSTNVCVAEALPDELRTRLVVTEDHPVVQAAALHGMLSLPDEAVDVLSRQLRDLVERDHSDVRLMSRIVAIMRGAQ